MEKLVTVIVPIYNCEKYIGNLIERLKEQTYKNIEVLLINDGSTDDSLAVCMKSIGKDERFKITNKKNEGVSKTRNLGLEIAKGYYIIFVDADDNIYKDSIGMLVEKIESDNNIDFAIGNYVVSSTNNKGSNKNEISENIEKIQLKVFNRFYDDSLDEYGNLRTVWGKIYKKEIIEKENIKFPEDIKIFEDGIFNFLYINSIKKYIIFSDIVYLYTINEKSAMHKKYADLYEQDEIKINNIKNILKRKKLNNTKYKEALDLIIFEFFCNFLKNCIKIDRKFIRSIIKKSIYSNSIKDVKCKYLSVNNKIIYYLAKFKFYSIIIFLCKIKNAI